MSDLAAAEPAAASGDARGVDLGWAAAACCAGAAVIHFAMVPAHAGAGLGEPLAFAAAGWFQLAIVALVLTGRADRKVHAVAALGNLAILGAWLWSRTTGLPWGAHPGEAETVGFIDGVCALLEVGAVVCSLRVVLGGERQRVSMLVPAFSAVAAVALGTVAVTSPDAANHSHSSAATTDAHTADMNRIDAERCDKTFNSAGYWQETKTLGVDTYYGGTMAMGAATATAGTSSDGHAHSHGATATVAAVTTTTRPDPLDGRGSAALDELVGTTKAAGSSEGAAGRLIMQLADADDATYDAWLWWMAANGQVGHAHDSSTPDEGHGGHAGPHVWTALTKPADCTALAAELDRAKQAALKYPTTADAVAGGYSMVTGYVPGIGAHYMNFSYLADGFDVDKPEMLLYDGTKPDSSVVGLSYYILGSPDAEPTQGFTGTNDHFHRHVGLCMKGAVVIGGSNTTEEECAARGGSKGGGRGGWMNHVWAVPGCESPWGVFSAASPVLDGQLGKESGTDGGGCAGSSVRDRYDMDTAAAPTAADAGDAARTPGSAGN